MTGKLASCPICIFKEMCIRDGRQKVAADLRGKVGGDFDPVIGCKGNSGPGVSRWDSPAQGEGPDCDLAALHPQQNGASSLS